MFANSVDQINALCAALSKDPESGTLRGRLVCKGLQLVAGQSQTYDAAVDHDFPFKKHFLALLTSVHTPEDGTLFAVFEDLALFVRLRSLKDGLEALSQTEKEILRHFETSGEWPRDARELVTESYWHDLPEQIQPALHL